MSLATNAQIDQGEGYHPGKLWNYILFVMNMSSLGRGRRPSPESGAKRRRLSAHEALRAGESIETRSQNAQDAESRS